MAEKAEELTTPAGPTKPLSDSAERVLVPLGLALLSAVGGATYALLRQTYQARGRQTEPSTTAALRVG